MSLPARFLITLLALVALAGGQVFGLQQGYLCECTGETVETSSTHCDVSPAGTATPCESHGHQHEVPVDTQEHAPLKVDLKAASHGKETSVHPSIGFVVAALPVLDLPEYLSCIHVPGNDTLAIHGPPDAPVNPSDAVQVARCMVLLV